MAEEMKLNSVAFIPDGNRRWAKMRGLPPIAGHKAGKEALKNVIRACNDRGVKFVTFYLFSTENWKRDAGEVTALMNLLQYLLDDFKKEMGDDFEKIRIQVLGDRNGLSKSVNKGIDKVEEETKNHSDIIVSLCINYGSRDEIIHAVKGIANDVKDGKISTNDINEELFSGCLYTKNVLDPDLLIRTSNELRLSNYLLWQLCYSEFYFAECLWPDFDEKELDKAFDEYFSRKRRYGK